MICREPAATSAARAVHHASMRGRESGGRKLAMVKGGEVIQSAWRAASEGIRWVCFVGS